MAGGSSSSAFRKAFSARTHRERAQPGHRSNLGALEKHKDYVERARSYHRKEQQLKALRIKATNKNPDEYYYRMAKAQMRAGTHVDNAASTAPSIPADMLKLMKTQDISYIRLQLDLNRKKLAKLEERLLSLQANRPAEPNSEPTGVRPRQHIIFAEDPDQREAILQREAGKSRGASAVDSHKDAADADPLAPFKEKPADRQARVASLQVQARRQRIAQLERIEYKMNLDRLLLQKGRRQKIGVDEHGFGKYKWSNERSK